MRTSLKKDPEQQPAAFTTLVRHQRTRVSNRRSVKSGARVTAKTTTNNPCIRHQTAIRIFMGQEQPHADYVLRERLGNARFTTQGKFRCPPGRGPTIRSVAVRPASRGLRDRRIHSPLTLYANSGLARVQGVR